MQFKLIIVFLCALFVAIFALQNSAPMMVNLFIWHFETKAAIVILGSAILGALCIGVLSFIKQVGVGVRILDHQGKIKKLEGEINNLNGEISSFETIVGRLEEEKLELLNLNEALKIQLKNNDTLMEEKVVQD